MPQLTPVAVPTAETVAFIRAHAPAGVSLLEIGCGAGDVAASLQAHGYSVTGIDSGEEAVRLARDKGVAAIVGQWPMDAPPADVIVFTRSLHHIHDLAGALRAARRTAPRLLIEDFDFYAIDEPALRWFVAKTRDAIARGIACEDVDELALRVANASNPRDAWRRDHDHELHGADAIRNAVTRQFVIEESDDAPYLYRYFVPILRETAAASAWLHETLAEEKHGAFARIGRRIAAS